MSWNQGGGPWGGGGGPSPWSRGPQPPNVEEMLRRSQDRLRRLFPGGKGRGRGILIAIVAIVALWIVSGFYRVEPDEQGIVLRFGAYNRTTSPGLNYHLPSPIEEALTPKVTRVNRVEIGFRESAGGRPGRATELPEESLMLTGDENIVDINFVVLWFIKDAKEYLFNIRNPDGTVKSAAESAMREVIGRTQIASAFAEGRGKIETDTQALLQEILDSYRAGVQIQQIQLQRVDPPAPVIDAFRDVQSAKIDQQRLINEAQAYANNVVPVAHGDAARIVQEAEAYRQQVVRNAEGDAARFLSVYDAYKQAEDVTARRLYLETMQSILQHTSKIILDKQAAASGVVPFLPLPQLTQPPAAAAAPSQAPASGGSGPQQQQQQQRGSTR
ncbi:MAG TPA: FtsH protease activity modulator HflK [Stellaceae bacterium]|nr:FtsH protease activity modulator HflK [Stellaceae bacterium]